MIFNSVPYKSNWNTFKIVKIWASSGTSLALVHSSII